MDEEIKKDMYDLNYSENFDIKDIEEKTVDIDLEDARMGGSTISGVVLDAERNPVENATIKIFDANGEPYLHTQTNERGEYTFSGLKSGQYSLTCVKKDYVITLPQSIILLEDELKVNNFIVQKDESLNLCSIAGIVYKMDTKEPIQDATVSLLNATTN